jgi:energy-converting hydrogenase Eha subunit H
MVLTLTLSRQMLLMFFIIVLTQWISNTTQELEDMLVDTQHFKIEQKEVENAFLKIKVNKSHGPDKICGRLLKSCAVHLSHVFNYILNMSLKEQHLPEICERCCHSPCSQIQLSKNSQ